MIPACTPSSLTRLILPTHTCLLIDCYGRISRTGGASGAHEPCPRLARSPGFLKTG